MTSGNTTQVTKSVSNWWRWSAIGALLIGATAGCKTPDATSDATNSGAASNVATTSAAKGEPIVLGQFAALTGPTATFGISTDNGIKMAVDEINARGGVLGRPLQVVTEDTASDASQAALAAKKLIAQNKPVVLIGEVASKRSLAAAPICQAAKVPMISPASTNPAVTKVGDYIFRTCFIDPFQGKVGARFALDKLKAKSAAILKDNKEDYSVGLAEFFQKEFVAGGGKIVAQEAYSGGDLNFRAQLTRIKAANPDLIFVPGYYSEVPNIAIQARSIGLSKPLMGGDGWDSSKLFEISKGALDGSYLSNHYSSDSTDPKVVKFVGDYKKLYKDETPDVMAVLGYDALYIVADAIKRAGSTDRVKVRDALAATKNFQAVTGNVTIDKDRNAIKPAVILQVKNNKYNYVSTVKP